MSATANKPKVLVVTTRWWPSDARLVATLRDAGCAVSLLCPTGHPARALRLDRVHTLRALRHARTLSRVIGTDTPDFLVPADERALRHLHHLHATGSAGERALVERSLGAPRFFGCMTSRLDSLRAAERAGLRVAATIGATTPEAIAAWAPTGPVILKSDGSSGGNGVRVAATGAGIAAAHRDLRRGAPAVAVLKRWLVNRDAFGLADLVRARPPAVVAQRHVEGRVGDLAMFCRRGEVLGVAVAIQEQCGRRLGASTLIRMLDGQHDLVAGAARLARQLELSGFVGLDFILDDRTGEAVVIEINPRVTPLASHAPGPGNPARAAARALGAAAAAPDRAAPSRDLVAYFPAAWRVDPLDPRLAACADDVPTGEPALLAELLRTPWPDRSLLARASALAGRIVTGRRRPGALPWPPRRLRAPSTSAPVPASAQPLAACTDQAG